MGIARLAGWLGRTVLIVVPVFVLATLVTFLLGTVSGLSPAGLMLGDAATSEDVARVNAQFGLDQPVVVRYLAWFAGLLRGDFGTSWFNGLPVSSRSASRRP